jgi:hypothetical protein
VDFVVVLVLVLASVLVGIPEDDHGRDPFLPPLPPYSDEVGLREANISAENRLKRWALTILQEDESRLQVGMFSVVVRVQRYLKYLSHCRMQLEERRALVSEGDFAIWKCALHQHWSMETSFCWILLLYQVV